ncbi:tRNA-dihydrouridine synthase [Actinotalea ferrariae CF5-4]|uniref:tRNA-dihydrouridine synthase n=2 Tax=Actinotalea TaxID=458839 RepID=A0A021VUK3_9CELL|nr:tRNA dihydrouridine synthase DusB [Actinotalea ferrariae]EYR63735.1 tRNA-dihydrouridine synthase [Actinotalea ferrariae CF5-4]
MGDNRAVPTTTTPRTGAPADGAAATGAVLPPLRIGPLTVETPVVLAPMAGVTNRAFRRLCREHGAGLYVAEMVTSRALVERTPESMRIIRHDADERPRSVQVYGVDPATVGAAVRLLAEEDRADHVDLNFGCPVPKVTRRGGGAVLPWKRDLFAGIVRAAVEAASPHGVPVTVKMRKGIDEDHLTYLEAGLVAQDLGVAAVALHARTAADYYSGTADWDAITRLKETVTDVPVLGNGDIWSAEDALEMVRRTGCDGVVVGRGCQGRPWLFADLAAAFHGSDARVRPGLAEVAAVVRRHGELMVEEFGEEGKAMREMRKHMAWYLKGYVVGGALRARLGLVESLAQLDDLLAELDLDQPYPGEAAEGQRGRAGSPKRPALPEGWLDSRELSDGFRQALAEAELSVSGG